MTANEPRVYYECGKISNLDKYFIIHSIEGKKKESYIVGNSYNELIDKLFSKGLLPGTSSVFVEAIEKNVGSYKLVPLCLDEIDKLENLLEDKLIIFEKNFLQTPDCSQTEQKLNSNTVRESLFELKLRKSRESGVLFEEASHFIQ